MKYTFDNKKHNDLDKYKPLSLKSLKELCQKYTIQEYYKGHVKKTPHMELITTDDEIKSIHLIFEDLQESYLIEQLILDYYCDISGYGNFQNIHNVSVMFPEKIIDVMDLYKQQDEPYHVFLMTLIYNVYYDKMESISRRGRTNVTGFLGVTRKNSNDCKQGFTWAYQYGTETGVKSISRVDLMDLRSVVKSKGLKWGVVDLEAAIHTCKLLGLDVNMMF